MASNLYKYACAYTYSCVHLCLCMCVYACAYTYSCVHSCLCMCVYACAYTYIRACIHVFSFAFLFICMCLQAEYLVEQRLAQSSADLVTAVVQLLEELKDDLFVYGEVVHPHPDPNPKPNPKLQPYFDPRIWASLSPLPSAPPSHRHSRLSHPITPQGDQADFPCFRLSDRVCPRALRAQSKTSSQQEAWTGHLYRHPNPQSHSLLHLHTEPPLTSH